MVPRVKDVLVLVLKRLLLPERALGDGVGLVGEA